MSACLPAEAGLLLFEEVAIEEDAADGMLEALLVVVCIVGGNLGVQAMAAPSRRAGGTLEKEVMWDKAHSLPVSAPANPCYRLKLPDHTLACSHISA